MKTRRIGPLALLLTGILGVVGAVAAQPAPTSAPHPTMPWNPYSRPDQGQPMRYIQVPAQQITIEISVNVPAGVPPQTQPQIIEILGYVMLETTTGYVIPERWIIVQTGAGVFQWQRAPAEFRRK